MEELFHTSDIGLASVLLANGFEVDHLEDGTKQRKLFYFCPHSSKSVREISNDYWAGELRVDPLAIFTAHRRLKGYLHDKTEQHE